MLGDRPWCCRLEGEQALERREDVPQDNSSARVLQYASSSYDDKIALKTEWIRMTLSACHGSAGSRGAKMLHALRATLPEEIAGDSGT